MESWVARLRCEAADFDPDADPRELRQVIDILELRLARLLQQGRQRGDHFLTRLTPTSWAARTCRLSRAAASDRLRVGAELESLPAVEEGVTSGRFGYQSAAAVCHLKSQLGEKWEEVDQQELVDKASRYSPEHFRLECRRVQYEIDPDGCDRFIEEDYERRWLSMSQLMDGMYRVDGVLDAETGSAFQSALQSLATHRGPEDNRTQRQRMADACGELMHHALDQGTLPRRNGVRPHISVTTTIEGLKRELGAAASELRSGIPISSRTMRRLACDGTLHRILKQDSVAIDLGRATRAVSPSQWRALKARYHCCAWPGCDRPLNWTNAHHVEFWAHGGATDVAKLLPLCWYHHRLVHEGEWQVAKASNGYRFIPPERVRGPALAWAA